MLEIVVVVGRQVAVVAADAVAVDSTLSLFEC